MQSSRKAKELIEQIAKDKRERLDGGGPDFRGSLKRLVDIWPDPSHALIELLQNADDAGTSSVEYGLDQEGIVFRHNGKPFTKEDVRAICSVDRSTKEPETHTGFMGIGFKAVFKLSDAPHVFSEPYRFRFSPDHSDPDDWGWILVPKWVETILPQVEKPDKDETVFWLPYKSELGENHRKRVEQAILDRFDSLSLMFLRKVKGLFVTRGNRRVRELLLEGDTVLEVVEGRKDIQHRYRLVGNDRLFEVPEEVKSDPRLQDSKRDRAKIRKVELAFGLDAESNLRPLKDAMLYVFLPTNYSTGLRFAVQGDFILATGRSEVDETLGWNRWLWHCAREVLQEAVELFKSDNRHRYQFYRVLPVKQDDFPDVVREELVEPFWEWCRGSPIVISSLGEWVKPDQAVIASRAVQEVLDADKLKELVGRRCFVHPSVEGAKTFLTEIGVVEFQESEVLRALKDKKWVEQHDDRWFTRLYHFLWDGLYREDEGRWKDWWRYYNDDVVKKLAVVRTSFGTVQSAEEVLFAPEDQADAALAEGIPGIAFVDNTVLDEKGRKLLEKWGVRKFETESVVRVILRGFESDEWESWSQDQLDRCVGFLREWLRDRNWEVPDEFRRRLGAVRVETESGNTQRADECYFRSASLGSLCPDGPFVVSSNDEDREFLKALGVVGTPRIRELGGNYGRWKGPDETLRWKDYFSWFRQHLDPRWNEVHEIGRVPFLRLALFEHPEQEPAIMLLEYLVRYWDGYYAQHTTATYRWRFDQINSYWRTNKTLLNCSYFAWQLYETAWLPTTKGLQKPSEHVFTPSAKVKDVAGDLATYVLVPREWDVDEFAKKGKKLFEFLGLRDKVDVKAALHLLEVAQEYPVDDSLRSHLARLYRHIGWLVAETTLWQPSLGQVALLTVNDEFELAEGLIWDDDPAIGQHFADSEALDFVWVPTGVERYYIENLLEAAGVKRLSTSVQRQLVASGDASRDDKWTSQLQDRARYMWSLLRHHRAIKADDIRQQLPRIEVFRSREINVLLQLEGVKRIVQCSTFYNSSDPVLFLTQSATPFEIASEFCRVFGLSFDHVSGIEMIVSEKDLAQIKLRFDQQGIALLDWEESPLVTVVEGERKEEDEQEPREEEEREGTGPLETPSHNELMQVEGTNIERIRNNPDAGESSSRPGEIGSF